MSWVVPSRVITPTGAGARAWPSSSPLPCAVVLSGVLAVEALPCYVCSKPTTQKPTPAAVGYVWAFAALTASPGARTHYDRRKTTGDRHTAAQRNLFNRLLGCLHHCLQTRQHYNEHIAFPTTNDTPTTAAA